MTTNLCCEPGCEEEGRDRQLLSGSAGIYCDGHWASPGLLAIDHEHPDDRAERDRLGLTLDQYDDRLSFERNCSCHLNPPCSNCIEHSELFPDEY